jgi:hypothetical protein
VLPLLDSAASPVTLFAASTATSIHNPSRPARPARRQPSFASTHQQLAYLQRRTLSRRSPNNRISISVSSAIAQQLPTTLSELPQPPQPCATCQDTSNTVETLIARQKLDMVATASRTLTAARYASIFSSRKHQTRRSVHLYAAIAPNSWRLSAELSL